MRLLSCTLFVLFLSSRVLGFSSTSATVSELQSSLLDLAQETERGFRASREDRQRARHLIDHLSSLSPTVDPARAYYKDGDETNKNAGPSLAGNWELVYTDAPDITSLQSQNGLAELGRIGQVCEPPFIKNVIEWIRPSWTNGLPLTGTQDSRILQTVVTQARASPNQPNTVNLKVAGLELSSEDAGEPGEFLDDVSSKGLLPALLIKQPVKLSGPLLLPFGRFEILYLDDTLRIVKTNQNFVAVNRRLPANEAWF